MNLRQLVSENFAGDLEYHPLRAAIYLILAFASAAFWYFTPSYSKWTAMPLVFGLGSLTLATKGIFLFRRSTEGIGMSDQELRELSASSKSLPPLPAQVAQVVQDFGAGPLLLWPLLNLGDQIDRTWTNPPRLTVFVIGAVAFVFGWLIRKYAQRGLIRDSSS